MYKFHCINLKQFNHQYHKYNALRSFDNLCSSLRLGILPSPEPGIHTQRASHKLPRIFTSVSSYSIFLNLGFTFNQCLIITCLDLKFLITCINTGYYSLSYQNNEAKTQNKRIKMHNLSYKFISIQKYFLHKQYACFMQFLCFNAG